VDTSTRIDPRPFVYLVLGLLVWWLAPAVFRSFCKDTFYEFQAPVLLTQSHLQDLQNYWAKHASRRDLIEANRDLAREVAGLSYENRRLRSLADENQRLERLLDLPGHLEYRTVVARVVRRDLNTWWQRLIVRRGSEDGVRVGSPVVIGDGVVGRVTKVHRATSEVQLLSDPAFRISASIDGDERAAVYQGGDNPPFAPPLGKITHLPSDYLHTPPGGTPVNVFTSGGGGVFPGGMPIGVVKGEVQMTAEGLFSEGHVQLHPRLSVLEEVAILIPLKPAPALID
jgi:rod shape-determining protein MreC